MVSSLDPRTERFALRRDVVLVLLLGAFLFLPFLGLRHVWTSGEARVAQVARQMRQSDDWLIPQIGERTRLKKPPLAYWLVALASIPFDTVDENGARQVHVTEFVSRIPNAVGGILLLLVIYFFGRGLHSREAGLVAVLALGATGIVWGEARTTGIEMPHLLFNTFALYAWWRYAVRDEALHPRWLWVCYVSLGLSILMKGIGPVIVLALILTYLGFDRRRLNRVPNWRHHLPGLALMLLIALPWFVYIYCHGPQEAGGMDVDDTLAKESIGRFIGFDHIKWPHYFFFKILGDGMPWILFALCALPLLNPRDWRRLGQASAWAVAFLLAIVPGYSLLYCYGRYAWALSINRAPQHFDWEMRLGALLAPVCWWLVPLVMVLVTAFLGRLLARAARFGTERLTPLLQTKDSLQGLLFPVTWAFAALIFFSVPMSKKSYYILPIYPALALLGGIGVAAVGRREATAAYERVLRFLLRLGGALGLAAGALVEASLLINRAIYPFIDLILEKRDVIKYSGHDLMMAAMGLVFLGLGRFLWRTAGREEPDYARRSVAGVFVAAVLLLGLYVALTPSMNDFKADKKVCGFIREKLRPRDRVATYWMSGLPIYTYYLDHHVGRFWDAEDLCRALHRPGTLYILTKEEDLWEFDYIFSVRAGGEALQRLEAQEPMLARSIGRGEGWSLVRYDVRAVEQRRGERPSPAEALAYVREHLGEPGARVVPLRRFVTRLPYPPVKNRAIWLRKTDKVYREHWPAGE